MPTKAQLNKMSIKELRGLNEDLAKEAGKIRLLRHAIASLIRAKEQKAKEA